MSQSIPVSELENMADEPDIIDAADLAILMAEADFRKNGITHNAKAELPELRKKYFGY